jgi:hypothetical protein
MKVVSMGSSSQEVVCYPIVIFIRILFSIFVYLFVHKYTTIHVFFEDVFSFCIVIKCSVLIEALLDVRLPHDLCGDFVFSFKKMQELLNQIIAKLD